MSERMAYQNFGGSSFIPNGPPWTPFPDDMWGKATKSIGAFFYVLVKMWDGELLVDATRETMRLYLNKQREAEGLPPVITKRCITWYLCELVRLGWVERERLEGTNTWTTKNKRGQQMSPEWARKAGAGLPTAPAVPTAAPDVSAEPTPEETAEIREESARSMVRTLSGFKWYLLLNDQGEPLLNANGALDWKRGVDATEPWGLWGFARKLDADIRALIASDPDMRALIEAARPARE
jgi:hypothetical protein